MMFGTALNDRLRELEWIYLGLRLLVPSDQSKWSRAMIQAIDKKANDKGRIMRSLGDWWCENHTGGGIGLGFQDPIDLQNPGGIYPGISTSLYRSLRLAVAPGLPSLKIKGTIESRAKRDHPLISLGHLFNTTAGNPVKKILLKLNLSDHSIKVKEVQRSFRHSDTERLSRSDEVLKLKNFKKDATLKLSKSTNQERYEHVGPEVASSQDGKVSRWRRDYAWSMISSCSRSQCQIQVQGTSSIQKSMITTTYSQEKVKSMS
ncbi:hypothetical protein Tco_0242182 [Tanacetum coccineum]